MNDLTLRQKLNYEVPIYSTRESNRGEVFTYTTPLWIALVFGFLAMFNILLWGSIGLWKAGEVIFG